MRHHRLIDAFAAELQTAPPKWLDRRYDAAGRALPEPGCTAICMIESGSARRALASVRAALAAEGLDRFWAWTPESSWHMTVFDLFLHANAERREYVPSGLPYDTPAAEVDAAIFERLRATALPRTAERRVSPVALYRGAGIGLALTGATRGQERRLRALRDILAAATGLRKRPGHADYGFHITLGYQISWPTEAEAARIDAILDEVEARILRELPAFALGTPHACRFEDMDSFPPVFPLG